MRIISGRYKGRVIKMPGGIRPTRDLVRKALFDILGDIEGLAFLELYAGSGAVGLEALSRGIKDLTLIEYNSGCALAIRKNIESLAAKACSLYAKKADEAVKDLHKKGKKFDIIFLDPPYYKKEAPGNRCEIAGCSGSMAGSQNMPLTKKTLQTLSSYDILATDGFIIVQHFKKDNLPETLGDLTLFRQSRYGDTLLSFYRRQHVPESDLSRDL